MTRTRFSPSPTGFLHVGGIRTALFAWLVARQDGGKFILRIEDTDQKRQVEDAETHIYESLKKLKLDYDEGPDKGGPFGPYRQSERLAIYKAWAQKLLDSGRAYVDPYSPSEVQAFREAAQNKQKPFLYRNHRPAYSVAWDGTKPLRFKADPKAYSWHDEVMGDMQTSPEVIDDFVLIKSDGFPTYNFAHIVDDAKMQITHVIRGQEFLASMPNYLNLYEALGITPPKLATVPHILAPAGNKKLSKRDNAKDVLDYLRDGFLPEAMINFIASLGWNDGTEQEIFSLNELKAKFSLKRVQKSGARFDEQRLLWMNGHYIRELSLDKLYDLATDYWPASAAATSERYKRSILEILQERLKYLAEISPLSEFFFEDPSRSNIVKLYSQPVDKKLKQLDKSQIAELLENTLKCLESSNFSRDDIAEKLNALLEQLNTKPGVLFAAIRIAVTGAASSPELFATMSVLGPNKVVTRLGKALEILKAQS